MSLPSGSWIESARDYKVSNGYVIADLRKNDGCFHNDTRMKLIPGTSLRNDDGWFAIESISGGPLPLGSWIHNARDVSFDGTSLKADIKNENGCFSTDRRFKVIPGCTLKVESGYFAIESVQSGPLPLGSWIHHTRDVQFSNNTLTADVKEDGSFRTSRRFKLIPGCTVKVESGYFAVESVYAGPLPFGTWVENTRDVSLSGSTLTADVRSDGRWHNSKRWTVTPGEYLGVQDGSFVKEDAPIKTVTDAFQNMHLDSPYPAGCIVSAYWEDKCDASWNGWYSATVCGPTQNGCVDVTYDEYPQWGSCSTALDKIRFPLGASIQAYWKDSCYNGWFPATVAAYKGENYLITYDQWPQWGQCDTLKKNVRA